PATVNILTSVQSPPNVAVKRAGGLDIDSSFAKPRGDMFPIGSYGHTGFTGGFFWIDPSSKTFFIFLSNRVHPNGKGNVVALQHGSDQRTADLQPLRRVAKAEAGAARKHRRPGVRHPGHRYALLHIPCNDALRDADRRRGEKKIHRPRSTRSDRRRSGRRSAPQRRNRFRRLALRRRSLWHDSRRARTDVSRRAAHRRRSERDSGSRMVAFDVAGRGGPAVDQYLAEHAQPHSG